MSQTTDQSESMSKLNIVRQFFKDTEYELAKVTWPARTHVVRASIAVFVILVLTLSFVGGLDFVLSHVFFWLKKIR